MFGLEWFLFLEEVRFTAVSGPDGDRFYVSGSEGVQPRELPMRKGFVTVFAVYREFGLKCPQV